MHTIYEGKSISKLQMDIERKQIRVLIWKMLLFLNIISLYIETLVPSFGAIRRMLEDFPLEISQRLICLVGSMGTRVDAA
jgi:hypothetical protein